MGIADIVSVVISLSSSKSPTRQGFGVPLIAAVLSAAAVARNPAVFRVYSSGSALTQAVADGILTTDPVYRALEVALAQPNVPPQIAIGRRTHVMTQVLKMTFASAVAGDVYVVTVIGADGVAHTYTLTSTGTPATDAASFAALMTAANIGTVTVSTSTITITQAAGKLTDLENWSTNIQVGNTTTDPGIAADLAAISAANVIGWYGLSLDSNSAAEIEAAQAWVDATGEGGKFAFYDTADYANVTSSTSDVFSTLESRSYSKCYLQQSNSQVLSYAGFGMASQILAQSVGSYTLAFKAIPGVITDTDATLSESQALILNTASTSAPGTGGKNGNYYKDVSGLPTTWPGVAPSGQWCDFTIGIDWLQANIQADVFAVLAGLPKVPFTDNGIGLIGDAIMGRLQIAAGNPYNLVDSSQPINVVKPKASAVSLTDKNNRNLSGMSFNASLTPGINTAQLLGEVTP